MGRRKGPARDRKREEFWRRVVTGQPASGLSIRREYRFLSEIRQWAEDYVQSLPRPIVVLQVRRTDRRLMCAPEAEREHYLRRLEALSIKPATLLAASDDPEWCGEFLPEVRWIDSPSPWHDMAVMTLCDGHALSRGSTFGWWGAWLARSSVVVAPWPWFSTVDRSLDALPAEWVKHRERPPSMAGRRTWKRPCVERAKAFYTPTTPTGH